MSDTYKNYPGVPADTPLNSPTQFVRVPTNRNVPELQSNSDLTFHVWTRPFTSLHSHENYLEIFIVTSGKLQHQFEDQTMVMKTGDAFLMFPGQCHQCLPYKNYSSSHINLTCSIDFAASMCRTCYGREDVIFPSQLVHLTDSEFSVFMDMQNVIMKSVSEDHLRVAVRSLISFSLGLFYLPRRELEDSVDIPSWLTKFLQQLQNIDFSNPVHLTDLYTTSGYSQSTLSMYFKKYMGQTLISYVNDLKLNHACNQLKNTSYTLSEIAKSSGFESYPHFSRLFKSKFGLTPQQYRFSRIQPPL